MGAWWWGAEAGGFGERCTAVCLLLLPCRAVADKLCPWLWFCWAFLLSPPASTAGYAALKHMLLGVMCQGACDSLLQS